MPTLKKQQPKSSEKPKWIKRFTDPAILWMHPARKAQHRTLLILSTSGAYQIYSYNFKTKVKRQLTNNAHGTIFASISPDGKNVFYLHDRDGNEHGHFVQIPFDGGRPVDVTPNLPPYSSYELHMSERGDCACFSASLEGKNIVYLVPFSQDGRPKPPIRIYEDRAFIQGISISPDTSNVCISVLREEKKTKSDILVFDIKRLMLVGKTTMHGTFLPYAWIGKKTEKRILGLTNAQGSYRAATINPYGDKAHILNVDASKKGDEFPIFIDHKEQFLLVCKVEKAQHKLLRYNIAKKTTEVIGPAYGSFDVFFGSVAMIRNSLILRWQAFNIPPKLIALKTSSSKPRALKEVLAFSPPIDPPRRLQSITIRSSDGSRVHMWVGFPDHAQKNTPFIIDIHGGPHGFASDEFLPDAHAWLDQGFGYCSVNYRGSIGFGKKFEEGIYGDPGYWEVEDIVAARAWLVKHASADPKKIIATGWSWGGYVTLLALGKYPNLWAGGIAGTPIGDCVLQYEDETAYFQSTDRKRFGGTPKEVPDQYTKSSPITYATDYRSPLLIFYGKNDVRCPPRQIENFIRFLKEKGKAVHAYRYSAGHVGDFSDKKLRIANMKRGLNFAHNVLKYGRAEIEE